MLMRKYENVKLASEFPTVYWNHVLNITSHRWSPTFLEHSCSHDAIPKYIVQHGDKNNGDFNTGVDLQVLYRLATFLN